jgi:hypothetical protein
MDKDLKKDVLESLLYFLGIIRVLEKHAIKQNHNKKNEYTVEKQKLKKIIEQLKKVKVD